MIQDAHNRTTYHNITLFDQWTEHSVYLLGYIEADGCILHDKRLNNNPTIAIQFACSEKDASYLQQLKNLCQFTGKTSVKTHKLKNGKTYHTHSFVVRSRFWKATLETHLRTGQIPTKIPQELLHHYIRGYFDGDGCIYLDTQTGYHKSSIVFSCYELACLFREKILEQDIKISNIHQKCNSQKCWYFQLSYKQTPKLGRFMYENSSVYMNRKYQLFTA